MIQGGKEERLENTMANIEERTTIIDEQLMIMVDRPVPMSMVKELLGAYQDAIMQVIDCGYGIDAPWLVECRDKVQDLAARAKKHNDSFKR
jgi:hypothetical protein